MKRVIEGQRGHHQSARRLTAGSVEEARSAGAKPAKIATNKLIVTTPARRWSCGATVLSGDLGLL